MAKEYLSKNERANYMYLLFFHSFMKYDFLPHLKNTYFTDEEITNVKKSCTWLGKVITSVLERIDNNTLRTILNASKVNALELMPRAEMQIKMKKILEDKHHIEVLTENALTVCYECNGKKSQCDLRDTLKILQVDIVGNEDKEICEYKFINTQEAV